MSETDRLAEAITVLKAAGYEVVREHLGGNVEGLAVRTGGTGILVTADSETRWEIGLDDGLGNDTVGADTSDELLAAVAGFVSEDAALDPVRARDDEEQVLGPECTACGMTGGEHFSTCPFHSTGIV